MLEVTSTMVDENLAGVWGGLRVPRHRLPRHRAHDTVLPRLPHRQRGADDLLEVAVSHHLRL